jgi:hypothetical protein
LENHFLRPKDGTETFLDAQLPCAFEHLLSGPKKTQYWFEIDADYMVLTYYLSQHEGVAYEKGKSFSKQGFTFTVDRPRLEGVIFQLTKRGKLGIFMPEGDDLDMVIAEIKPLLDEAAGKNVLLRPLFTREHTSTPVSISPKGGPVAAVLAPNVAAPVSQTGSPYEGMRFHIVMYTEAVHDWITVANEKLRQPYKWPDKVKELIAMAQEKAGRMMKYLNPIRNMLSHDAKKEITDFVTTIPENYREEFTSATIGANFSEDLRRKTVSIPIEIAYTYLQELQASLDTLAKSLNGDESSLYKTLAVEAKSLNGILKRIPDLLHKRRRNRSKRI